MTKKTDLKSALRQLEETLELYLGKKAPSIPTEWKELIVKIAPWLAVVLFIFTLPAVLTIFGLGALVLPFSYLGGIQYSFNYLINFALSLVVLVLSAMAIPGLFKRAARSWRLLYYAALVSAVGSLVAFNLGALIVGTGISLYILFQVKDYYK